MDALGAFLKKLRGKMTYREAAEKSGLSHSYIRYLEMGKRPGTNTPIHATPESLKGLAEAYNYPYEKLMEKAGYLPNQQNNDVGDEFSDKFSRLNEKRKKLVMNMIDSYLEDE